MMDHHDQSRWDMATMEAGSFTDYGQPTRTIPIPSNVVLAAEGELAGLRRESETRGLAVLVAVALAFGVGLLMGWAFAPMVG